MHVDFTCHIDGEIHTIWINSHEKYPKVLKVSSIRTSATISVLDNKFAYHGLPENIVSENEKKFASTKFTEYCKNREWRKYEVTIGE